MSLDHGRFFLSVSCIERSVENNHLTPGLQQEAYRTTAQNTTSAALDIERQLL